MSSILPSSLKLFLPATCRGKLSSIMLFACCMASQLPISAKMLSVHHKPLKGRVTAAGSPTISYSSPQVYPLNTTITALAPTSTGVSVPAYSSSAVTVNTGVASPFGVATDAAGNLYVSDLTNAIVKEFPANGGAPVIIGSGQFLHPMGLAVDAAGNVFAADGYYGLVREVLKSDGSGHSLGTGFNELQDVALDAAGNVYVADLGNSNPVKKILKSDGSTTFAGTGFGNYVTAVAVDAAGNIYVADASGGGNLDEILASNGSTITLVSGLNNPQGVAVDPMGNVFFSEAGIGMIKELPAGSNTPITLISGLTNPGQVAVDGAGNVYFVDTTNGTVQEIKPVGGYYISTNLPAGLSFNGATGVISGTTAAVSSGPTNYTVTAYNAAGKTSAVINITVGTPPAPTLSYAGPNTYTRGIAINPLVPSAAGVAVPAYTSTASAFGSGYSSPRGIATDAAGNVYLADFGNNTVKKISPNGSTVVNVGSGFSEPTGVAVDAAGNIYIADFNNDAIKKIPAGQNTPVVIGTGIAHPYSVAVDLAGNVYVANNGNNNIQKIHPDGVTTESLGTVIDPLNVAVDAAGNVYITNGHDGAIQKLAAGQSIPVTINTSFSAPFGITVDAAGNIYVADININGVTEIPANGSGPINIGSGYSAPISVAVNTAGKVYVANYSNAAVNEIDPVGGYYLNTALPAGLSFNGATGVISGTPTAVSAAKNYTVTAYNISGSAQATVNLNVVAPTSIVSAVRSYTQNPTNIYYLAYTVTFAAPVTGLIPSNFSVTTTGGITGAAVNSVTGSGTTYTVGVVSGSGDGTVTLNMANSLGVVPGISTSLPFVGETYTIDKTAPQATELNYYSSNADIQKAVVGDVIHLELGADEAVQAPVVTIAGHTVTAVSTGGNFYAATYTMKLTDAPGRIPFTVDFTDLAGNTSPHYTDGGAGDDIEFSLPVTGPAPTIQAMKVLFSNITTTNTSISWTKGNGSQRAVFILKGANGSALPANAVTYTANTTYGSGTQIGSTGWYCIYNGTGTSVNVSGLLAGTIYRVTAVEYNGTTGQQSYLTTGLSPASVQTVKIYPTVPALKVVFSNITTTSTTVNWTNGDGTARAVFIAKTANGSAIPVDGTAYTANTTFGSGTQVGATSWYCIYNGTGSTVNVTGLLAGTTYRVTTVEYNTISGVQKYLTTGLSPASVTTVKIYPTVPALQVKFTNTTGSSTTASWTNGDGTARAVFIAKNSNGHATPVDAATYTANSVFAAGAQIGSTGWHCIYDGTGSTVNISGLTSGTTYRVTVVEYMGTAGNQKYLITGLSPANVTTTGFPPLNSLYLPKDDGRTPFVATLNSQKIAANNILSPNGDGVNDIWVVKNIAFYPNNTVSVYDHTGKVVFTKKGYSNDWAGTYRGSGLNEGTYYYSIDLGNGKNVKGFITVVAH